MKSNNHDVCNCTYKLCVQIVLKCNYCIKMVIVSVFIVFCALIHSYLYLFFFVFMIFLTYNFNFHYHILSKYSDKASRLFSWWRHQMQTFSALLAICAVNSPVPGEFPAQRPVTRSFDVFFDLRLNKRLSKHSWGWWFETLSRPLWRHCN